jgi:protease-4
LLDLSRRPDDEERRVVEGQIQRVYDEFKDRVARGRDIDAAELEPMAGGRVWTGEEALELGLVDEIGGFREALRRARELGGIQRDVPEVLLRITPPRSERPTPGEPAQVLIELVGEVWGGVSDLGAGGVRLLTPYEIRED